MSSNHGGSGPSPSLSAVAGPSSHPMSSQYDQLWSQASSAANPRISAIRRRLPRFPSAPLRIQRVSQLDAELLDEEVTSMLLEPIKSSLSQIKSTLPDQWEPELLALLKLVLFKYSIWDRGASYGAMLQNLKYRNEWAHKHGLQSTFLSAPLSKTQLTLYPLLTIVLPYVHEKLNRRMTATQSSHTNETDATTSMLYSAMDKVQRCYEGVALLNFLAFLGNGKYRTVTDRVLGMRLTYAERTLNRNVSFEFLNRQLVWHAFTEFLLFLLPIIRPRRLLRRLMRLPTHPRILAFWLHILPAWLSRRVGLYKDSSGRPSYRLPVRLPFTSTPAQKEDNTDIIGQGKHHDLPSEICAICWDKIEQETSSSSSISASGAISIGIPTSDPLDPSSGALAPTNNATNRRTSSAAQQQQQQQQLIQSYHQASHEFGVSNKNGIPFSNALIYISYETNSCHCVYCYHCLAEKLLSEDAGEELEDGDKGAWKCLRCNTTVSGMSRHSQEQEQPDPEKEEEVEKEESEEEEEMDLDNL
ncbi:unnamed protein product [Sympodiomycopsis kandeliae]